ncbi:MAG TPA: hypothetical protein VG326_09435 [Tepidisphaeraceae bacterium]|jgi:hypothetical protein|nr:hypothetical protein [Tepidisphaeraceae bacterium]
MLKTLLLAGLLGAGLPLISGCGVQTNKPLITYERNAIAVAKLNTVETRGLYVLFPGNGITPLDAVYLHPGDVYGFKTNEGRVAGFYIQAGTSKFVTLDGVLTSEYTWKFEGEKQP